MQTPLTFLHFSFTCIRNMSADSPTNTFAQNPGTAVIPIDRIRELHAIEDYFFLSTKDDLRYVLDAQEYNRLVQLLALPLVHASADEPAQTDNPLLLDLSGIPEDWFLWSLWDHRTRVAYAGEKHKHLAWKCQLQHVAGGRLTYANGETPQVAVDLAIQQVAAKSS